MEVKPGPVDGLVLSWATFTEAADESRMSRRYAGLHFEDADLEGRFLGRRVAALACNKDLAYMSGNETERRPLLHSEQETDIAGC